ncbi:hypothetical protein BJF86_00325 [Serinicoccus sp. CNJ-927]|uniref:hypothetical protein n=1 Tax=Serinicoccus sp. CNJ-927 TaxID=1904970 RepID=UPI000961C8F1|nr:hypothetical protein [Serinicoccus sp. CNJ-927]OLT43296.1 hypothetical protein BJF86_00325 [Serinicoccus sp. CNJ-927]
MRRRHLTRLASLLLVAVLAACTSEPTEEPGTETSAPAEQDAAATDGSGSNGWLCEDVSPQSLRALAGDELTEPREVMVADDETRWVCEAYDGQTPLVRVSVEVGEEGRETARSLVEATEGMAPGPDYLGESYLSPTVGVGLTLCGAQGSGSPEPYSLTAEILVDREDDLREPLRSTLTSIAQKLDQGVGCSPKQAREEAAEQTVTP